MKATRFALLVTTFLAVLLSQLSSSAKEADIQKRSVQVEISGFAFVPAQLTIKKGQSVIFTNKDSTPHTVSPDKGAVFADSGRLLKNESKTITFDTSGKQQYFCQIHPSMKGTVIVR